MRAFVKIDAFVLDTRLGVQALATAVGRLFEIKYYTLAKTVAVLAAASIAHGVYIGLVLNNFRGLAVLAATVLLLGTLYAVHSVWQIIVLAQSNTERGHRNPNRDDPAELFGRMVFLALSTHTVVTAVLDSEVNFFDVAIVTYTLSMFLAACQEPPPEEEYSPVT